MSDPKIDFIEHLYQLERKLDAVSNHPRLGNSSVHGQRIDFYDQDNNRLGSLGDDNGLGFDYEDGPEPPTPAPPVATADAGVISVEWAGQWADGSVPSVSDPDVSRTRDLEGVEIHLSRDPLFEPDVVSMRGIFTSPDGGSYAVGPVQETGEYYVRLRARSRSGKVSAPSEMVVVEVAAALIDLQLAEMQVRTIDAQESADGKNRIFRGPTVPDPALGPFNVGDTWFNTADSNMPSQWDGERWVSVADERVHALEQVQADLRTEIENISVTAGGNTITRSAVQPGDAQGVEGDTWFVLLDGKVVEQWHYDGSGWVTSELASSVIADLHAGKITSGYIDSARIEAGSLVADTVLVPGSAGSTVIRDGAVTTEKIAAGAITAESGIIGSLDVGKVVAGELDGMFIKAGAITAEKIKSGAITATALSADAIDGKFITGATIRTSSLLPRVEMNPGGLFAWDAQGDQVFGVDSTTGNLGIIGTLRTAPRGQRGVELNNQLFSNAVGVSLSPSSTPPAGHTGQPALLAMSDEAGWGYGSMSLSTPSVNGVHTRVEIQPPGPTGGGVAMLGWSDQTRRVRIQDNWLEAKHPVRTVVSAGGSGGSLLDLYGARAYLAVGDSRMSLNTSTWRVGNKACFIDGTYDGFVEVRGDAGVRVSNGSGPALSLSDSGWGVGTANGQVSGTAAGSVAVKSSGFAEFGGGGGAVIQVHNTERHIKFVNTSGFQFSGIPTGSGTGLNISSSGWIQKNSSSAANKLLIEDIGYGHDDFEDALLSIPARSWVEAGESERYAEYLNERASTFGPIPEHPNQTAPTRIPGAVAEEVHEAGLGEFVVYDQDGNPDGLLYDRFGVALIPVVARLRDRVVALESALADLSNKQ